MGHVFKMPRKKKRKRESDGKKALKMVRRMKSAVEVKHFDFSVSDPDVNYNGEFRTINEVPLGDTGETRDGDSLFMTSYEIRGRWEIGVTGDKNTMRIIVLLDKGGLLVTTPGDLMEVSATQFGVVSAYAQDNRHNWTLLADRTYSMYDNKPVVPFHFKGKLNKKVQYSDGSTTAFTKNALRIYYISNAAGATGPTINFYSRVFFSDN